LNQADFSNDSWIQNVVFAGWNSFIIAFTNEGRTWHCHLNEEKILPDDKAAVNRLTHVALVLEPAKARFYLDGRLIGVKELNAPLPPAQGRVFLGCYGDKTSCLNGRLYAVRFSTTARYKSNFIPHRRFEADKETLALYHFDEGAGNTLRDSSGNGYDGTISGAKWVRVDAAEPTKAKDEIALVHKFEGHTGPVGAVDVSPDGRLALSAGMDEVPRLWDLQTGKVLHGLRGHRTHTRAARFSPDGKLAATGDSAGVVLIWDVRTGKELHRLNAPPRTLWDRLLYR
jgi:WD40 repeat protein